MTRRMLDSRLWANEHFGEMPMMARLLLLGIINHADDQGRIKGKLMYLRTEIFRYDREVSDEQVGECLKLIEANSTIECYAADGKECIQLLNWWDYQSLQFAAPSDIPRSPTWQDRIRYNSKGGRTLTYNWKTPKGEEPVDTCDQDGNPLPAVAELPPRNPGGRPPQNPPVNGRENPGGNPQANPNKDQIKININQEGDRARASEPPPVKPTPPLVVPLASLPGVRTPRWNQDKRDCDMFMVEAGKLDIGAEPFRLMVDIILSATGKTALANTSGEQGQKTLNAAKQTVIDLAEMERRTLEDVQEVLTSWRENDYRGASPPTFAQIVEHASAMLAGTHITARRQESGKKEFASFQDYNEWAARNDPDYKRISEGILVKGTFIKRADYQPARVH